MEFSSNPNTKCTENPQSSISTHPFSDVPSQKYLNLQVRTDILVNSVFSPPLSYKISLRVTSFHISLNSLGFSLQNCLLNFLSCIFQHVWEKVFSLWCSHSPKMNWMYHFYSCPSPLLKTPGRIFWKSVFPQTRWRKLWFALSKFNQKIWRWLGTLVYFHLVWLQFF